MIRNDRTRSSFRSPVMISPVQYVIKGQGEQAYPRHQEVIATISEDIDEPAVGHRSDRICQVHEYPEHGHGRTDP